MADDHSDPPSVPLYEADFLAWTEQQGRMLRARQAGSNSLDWDNLAEEVEDLGKSEFHSCESWVELIIEHLLKIQVVGTPDDLRGWRKEVRGWRKNLRKRLTPTMRNRLLAQLPDLHAAAARDVRLDYDLTAAPQVHYSWDQITDADWYPEPAITDPR